MRILNANLLGIVLAMGLLFLPPTLGRAVEWATGGFWDGYGVTVISGLALWVWLHRMLADGEKA